MTSLTDLRDSGRCRDRRRHPRPHPLCSRGRYRDRGCSRRSVEITVEATPEGYAELVEFANSYPMLRAWAIEGTGSHGAGLSRQLLASSEVVIELDRPKRAARRNGAKSDPLDAVRAAREAMARPRLGSPRSGGERHAEARPVSAVGCPPLGDQRLYRGPVAGLQPGDRCSRTYPGPVPWSEASRDAHHRREPARACVVGRRDDQHGRWRCGLWLVARTRC